MRTPESTNYLYDLDVSPALVPSIVPAVVAVVVVLPLLPLGACGQDEAGGGQEQQELHGCCSCGVITWSETQGRMWPAPTLSYLCLP